MSNAWKKSVRKLRTEVQSYYDEYLRVKGEVEKAKLDLEEAQREEQSVRAKSRERVYVELAKHNVKGKELTLQAKKDELKRIQGNRFALLDKSRNIRNELSEELDDAFTVNADDVDSNVMTLISSGILKAQDYEKLYDEASKAGNVTMMRILGKTAGDLAGKTTDSGERSALNGVYYASVSGKRDELQKYDEYAFAVSRGTGNPMSVNGYQGNPKMFEYFLDQTADMGDGE